MDQCSGRVLAFLERRPRDRRNGYENQLYLGLKAGMTFTHADLYARSKSLTPRESELFDHLNRGYENLVALIFRLEQIGALSPRQSAIRAAIDLGLGSVYEIHSYANIFRPILCVDAA